MRLCFVAWAVVMAVAGVACGSPTEPDPRITPAVGTPTRMQFLPCEYGAQTAACRVEARWGDLYSTTLDVTNGATWTSSASNIVNVDRRGVLSARGPGDADITVAYEGRSVTATFRVMAEGPPWFVLRGSAVEYHIEVVDDRGARLEGVLVEIVGGAGAGSQAVSDSAGRAIFRGESACGPITVRGTKDGYQPWVGSATKCGRAGNGNWGSETVGPVRMIPLV
jgi:hypothetical protein